MHYNCLGLMSGTSLDGLDIAYCEFDVVDNKFSYSIPKSVTIPYDDNTRALILNAETCSATEVFHISSILGHYFGKCANKFIKDNHLNIDFIASHGQTIFHRPEIGYTVQIGDVSALRSEVSCTVIGDFRSLDIALGGQGAPLVPIGDKYLFSDYDVCVNIGGFSNLSFENHAGRIAFDVCPANMIFNFLSSLKGKAYDKNGTIARSGKLNKSLLQILNSLPYYATKDHHSLGKEWVTEYIMPILQQNNLSVEDKMATYVEHVSYQISKYLFGKVLITGGGAKNNYLIEQIKKKTTAQITIPPQTIIDYKEALIFAFMGLRRLRSEINCLKSVTGAKRDCCSGVVI